MKRNDFRNSATRLYCSSFYSTKLFLIEKTNKQNKQSKTKQTNKQTKQNKTKQTNKAKQNKQTKQNKTKQSQRVSVGSIKCIVIYLTVRNRSRWKRTQQEVSRHLRSSLKKSAFGERRFYIQLPHITDHQGHAIGKVPCSNYFEIPLKYD